MTTEEFQNIEQNLSELKDLPNSKLIESMDLITKDFEITKTNIIQMTLFLDKLEEIYDKMLKEYQSRK